MLRLAVTAMVAAAIGFRGLAVPASSDARAGWAECGAMGRSDIFDPVRIFNTNCRTAHRVLTNASCTSTLRPGHECVWFYFRRWKCRGATPEVYLMRCQNEDKRIVAGVSIPD